MTALASYAVFMLLTGRYLEKYGPRTVIFTGSLLVSLGWILSAFATNISVLTVTYGIISGAGVGIAYGAPLTVVAKWFPGKKGLMVGTVLIGFGLSPLITAPLARSLIENYGIMKAFLILGVSFGIILPMLSYSLKYPSESDSKMLKLDPGTKYTVKEINTSIMIKSRDFKGLYCNFLIGSMIGLMLIGMTNNVGIELIGLTPRSVALLMSLFAIFNGIGRPTFGRLVDKLSSKKAMLISYGLIIIAALLMLLAQEGSVGLFGIAFSIFWFNLGGWLAIAPTSTLAMFGSKYYSQNYGVVFTAYGIGAITGVLASGLLLDELQHYQSIFYLVIGLCILGILLTQKGIRNND